MERAAHAGTGHTMSGRVIAFPARAHKCAPGWRDHQGSDGCTYGVPPTAWDFPKGAVWQCACGRTWISQGAVTLNSPGFTHWKPESQRARRRRERRQS